MRSGTPISQNWSHPPDSLEWGKKRKKRMFKWFRKLISQEVDRRVKELLVDPYYIKLVKAEISKDMRTRELSSNEDYLNNLRGMGNGQ
jgi:hypothetical protein